MAGEGENCPLHQRSVHSRAWRTIILQPERDQQEWRLRLRAVRLGRPSTSLRDHSTESASQRFEDHEMVLGTGMAMVMAFDEAAESCGGSSYEKHRYGFRVWVCVCRREGGN